MAKAYNHKTIEKKWQSKWRKGGANKQEAKAGRPKCYVLDMFPYISGAGLHVGHPRGYIATDIYSRFKKMTGHNILHPIGWDSFGLPAENYAIEHKIHPQIAVDKNIKRFKEQLSLIGFNYDWDREINTADPNYYKWTQWIFLQLYEKGLAYESSEPINWCPSCQTGLANEDLENGRCERCGSEVEKKPMRQWVLKITKYADRLLKDLDKLAWPESVKEAQRNWIGRSEGLLFTAPVKDSDLKIQTFSAHFEAFCADTFVVIAPDHPLLPKLLEGVSNKKEILNFAQKLIKKRLATSYQTEKEVEGIFTGRYIVDPVGNGDLPIWIASYALADYGTGIVKCSAHDERDFKFAKKYGIKLKEVIEPLFIQKTEPGKVKNGLPFVEREAITAIVKHWSEDKYIGLKWKKVDWDTLITGGVEPGQNPEEAAIAEIREETGYQNPKLVKTLGMMHSQFFHVPKNQNRFAHFHVMYFELSDGNKEDISDEENQNHEVVWLTRKEMEKFRLPEGHRYSWNKLMGKEIILTDMKNSILSEPKDFAGKIAGDCRTEIIKYLENNKLAEKKITYRLKDWVFSRQRYWGEPIPIIHCAKCGVVPVPEKDLPVKLPVVKAYAPTGTSESPLANITKWINVRCPKCGGPGKRETNTMPQWAGSSWYYLRYIDPKNNRTLVDKKKEKYWSPVDMYVGGTEHVARHMIYARFWHKFLYDIKAVNYSEPFSHYRYQGLILASDGRKMSKRFNNVINPDDVIKTYGADTLRVYEMFMGPFNQTIAWSTESMIGSRRFLEKVWRQKEKVSQIKNYSSKNSSLIHKTIKKVADDIESFSFNTAISSLMILVNAFDKEEQISLKDYRVLIRLLAPFAPHMTEELWQEINDQSKKSVHLEPWPEYDSKKVLEGEVTIVIQINGKVRDSFKVANNLSEEEVKSKALAREMVKKWFKGDKIKKLIYVKNRLINIVK